MALIRELSRGSRDVRVHPTTVDALYESLISESGDNLLQLTTFGSDARQNPGTPSQTLQFDRRVAAQLVEVIRLTFPGL